MMGRHGGVMADPECASAQSAATKRVRIRLVTHGTTNG